MSASAAILRSWAGRLLSRGRAACTARAHARPRARACPCGPARGRARGRARAWAWPSRRMERGNNRDFANSTSRKTEISREGTKGAKPGNYYYSRFLSIFLHCEKISEIRKRQMRFMCRVSCKRAESKKRHRRDGRSRTSFLLLPRRKDKSPLSCPAKMSIIAEGINSFFHVEVM